MNNFKHSEEKSHNFIMYNYIRHFLSGKNDIINRETKYNISNLHRHLQLKENTTRVGKFKKKSFIIICIFDYA